MEISRKQQARETMCNWTYTVVWGSTRFRRCKSCTGSLNEAQPASLGLFLSRIRGKEMRILKFNPILLNILKTGKHTLTFFRLWRFLCCHQGLLHTQSIFLLVSWSTFLSTAFRKVIKIVKRDLTCLKCLLLCSLLTVGLVGQREIHMLHSTGDLHPLFPCHSLTESYKLLSLSYQGLFLLIFCNYPIQKILSFLNYCRIYYQKYSYGRKISQELFS